MALPVEAGPSPQPVASTQHRVLTGAGNTVIKASIVDSGQTCDYGEAHLKLVKKVGCGIARPRSSSFEVTLIN